MTLDPWSGEAVNQTEAALENAAGQWLVEHPLRQWEVPRWCQGSDRAQGSRKTSGHPSSAGLRAWGGVILRSICKYYSIHLYWCVQWEIIPLLQQCKFKMSTTPLFTIVALKNLQITFLYHYNKWWNGITDCCECCQDNFSRNTVFEVFHINEVMCWNIVTCMFLSL